MNSHILTITNRKTKWTVDASPDQSILQILRENQIYMPAPCGGRGTCGKCKIKAVKGSFAISALDEQYFSEGELRDGYRLACMCRVQEDSEIMIEAEKGFSIVTAYQGDTSCTNDIVYNSGLALERVVLDIQGSLTDFIESRYPGKTMDAFFLRKLTRLFQGQDGSLDQKQVITLTDSHRMLDIFIQSPPALLGVAIDIGTTTICFELVDLLTGHRLGSHACINRQREYGADVISRIMSAGQGNLPQLHEMVISDIIEGIRELSLLYFIETENVYHAVISGNTTMLHLLLGIPCNSLGVFPFTPVMTNLGHYSFSEIFGDGSCHCPVTLLPSVSAYVGADITAGIAFCGGKSGDRPSLLIDLGTNGEMAVFSGSTILCTATAAGPAFEGGNISCGTGSIPGAISSACYKDGALVIDTIGGQTPVGICGSGVIDIVAVLVKAEIIEETGLMGDDYFESGFPVVPAANIAFTQQDVRELQLAKAAVRAGIEVLLQEAHVSYEDIQSVYLAGGFGHKINLDNAVAIGLIPSQLRDKVTAIGNSSLGGCVQVLTNQSMEKEIIAIAGEAKEINLSHDKRFNDFFMEFMYF